MTIFIKDMVCVRCKMAVRSVLEELGIAYQNISLGSAVLSKTLTTEELANLSVGLQRFELALMSDRKKILTERIKTLIIETLRSPQQDEGLKLSVFVSRNMAYDYTYLANLFSEVEGTTIERFYIEARIERAKELLVYEDMTPKEIAYELNYSSLSHLGQQFKKVTGYTPADFKKQCGSGNFIWKKEQQ